MNETILYQNENGGICESKYGIHENVKIIAVSYDEEVSNSIGSFEPFIYKSDVQKALSKVYLSVIDPEKYEEKSKVQKEQSRARDKERDQTLQRKNMHAAIDKERDKTPKRKGMHAEIDHTRDRTDERKARDQTPKRKAMHATIDQERDETLKRKIMHASIDKERDET